MLYVPHYHHSIVNTACVHKLLALVNDACLWIGEPIPITDMLIHMITNLPYKIVNPAKELGGKIKEKYLVDKMKKLYGLVKNSNGYFICIIQY